MDVPNKTSWNYQEHLVKEIIKNVMLLKQMQIKSRTRYIHVKIQTYIFIVNITDFIVLHLQPP